MVNIGLPEILILLIVLGFGLCGSVLWVWMLIDCVRNEPAGSDQKIAWVLVIAFTHWLGALFYLAFRRPARRAQFGR